MYVILNKISTVSNVSYLDVIHCLHLEFFLLFDRLFEYIQITRLSSLHFFQWTFVLLLRNFQAFEELHAPSLIPFVPGLCLSPSEIMFPVARGAFGYFPAHLPDLVPFLQALLLV